MYIHVVWETESCTEKTKENTTGNRTKCLAFIYTYIDGMLITLHIIIWTSIKLNAIVAISLSSHNFLPIDSYSSHGADIPTV